MSHADVLKKNYDVLQRCTTIDFYVIDYLRAEDVLDEEQEHDLKTERNPLRQRILLYQWLKKVSHDKYESFLQVMKDTEQGHVANLLKGDTEGDHLPLSDARHRRLVKIRHKMARVTRIDNEVIVELRSQEAISMTDAEEIRAEKVESTRVSKLISVIMRRSNHSYNCFEEVLRKTLQKAAANFLSEGEMPAVHLNNKRPDLDEPLSIAFNDVIRNGTENDVEINGLIAELHELGLDPANARPGQSIVIFIYCKTVDSASKFTQLFNFGRLQSILERILNRLLLTIEPHNTETLNSIINMEDEDVIALEEFTGIEGWMVEGLHRSKPFGKRYSNVATTQTERWNRRRQNTEQNKYKSGSSAFAGKTVGRTPQDKQENPTSGSGVRSGAKTQWEKLVSGSIIVQSSAESLSERKSLSLDRSSPTSQIADDDSGVYGWTLVKGRHSEKKVEEMKPSIRDKGLSGRAYKSEKGRLPDMPARDEDIFELKLVLEETQKENDRLTKQLEQPRERVSIVWKQDYFVYLNWKLDETQKENVQLMRLLEHHTQREKYQSGLILIQTMKIEVLEELNKSIKGLTILDKELFVIIEKSSEVEVYDLLNFNFLRRWNLKELDGPTDMGSCNKNKCLYIFNSKGFGEILRVDPNGKLLKSWRTVNSWFDCFLSVTKESNVTLTVCNEDKLHEYSPDGMLIREINLSAVAGIHHPRHAIQMSNGHFLISHKGDDRQFTVSIVDSDGKLQKSLSGESKLIIGKMDGPVYLSVDGNGFVMAADQWNGRVLLLDSELKFQREILSKGKDRLRRPERILLDETNRRLFVVDNELNNRRILIFEFE